MENFFAQKFEEMQYVMRLPENYEEGKRYPVLLFLHGAGTRGTNINKLKYNAFFKETAKYEDFPFVTVAPLCHENSWFDLLETLKRFTLYIRDLPFADTERMYVMGNSMGGYGTWQMGISLPEVFAAMVPLCGGGMYPFAGRLIDMPVWAFHGGMDTVVPPEESKKMVDAVNKRGGNAKLTIYPEKKHNIFAVTYQNKAVFDWLLTHKRISAAEVCDEYNDAEKYG